MSIVFDLLILLIVAAVCGSLGMAISGFSRGGCLMSIALGFIGALDRHVDSAGNGLAHAYLRWTLAT